MVSVYVLIRADGDKVWETVTGVKEIDGVTRSHLIWHVHSPLAIGWTVLNNVSQCFHLHEY
jgi:hypothetical protein